MAMPYFYLSEALVGRDILPWENPVEHLSVGAACSEALRAVLARTRRRERISLGVFD